MHLRDFADEFTARDWDTGDPDGTVRFAMVGLGWWTREEAIPAVEASEYCETTVVVTSSAEKAARGTGLADTIEHGITYDEFHAGEAVDAYDAVYIVTPNALHLPYVETAADLGKDVLCEKPMEVDVERSRTMVDACAAADVTLMIAYRMQTEPAVRRVRDLIAAGAIGDPVLVHGTMSQRLLEIIPDPDQWRLDPDRSGGATVMDIGLYPLNTSRFVLDADPVAVHAHTAAPSEPFADVGDEHVSFGLAFENGVHAACTASQNAYQASNLRVTGTEGELEVDPAYYTHEPRALRFSRGGQTFDVEFDQVNQMTEEFDYFAHCLLTDAPPHPNGEHGLVDMTVMGAIYEAAAREETVHLE